jgi:hypothetical protein
MELSDRIAIRLGCGYVLHEEARLKTGPYGFGAGVGGLRWFGDFGERGLWD